MFRCKEHRKMPLPGKCPVCLWNELQDVKEAKENLEEENAELRRVINELKETFTGD